MLYEVITHREEQVARHAEHLGVGVVQRIEVVGDLLGEAAGLLPADEDLALVLLSYNFV